MGAYEPGQVRKEAAVSRKSHVPGCIRPPYAMNSACSAATLRVACREAFFLSFGRKTTAPGRSYSILQKQDPIRREGGALAMLSYGQWMLHNMNRKDELTRLFDGLFLVMDEAGVIANVQSDLAWVFGLRPEAMAGRSISEFLAGPGPVSIDELAAGVETDRPILTLTNGNGEALASAYSMFRFESEQGTHYSLALLDLGGKSKLSLLQRFAGAFMKDVNLGVLLINPRFELVEISDAACQVLGIRREESLGKPMDEIFSEIPMQHRLVQPTLLDGAVVKNHAVSWANDRGRYDLIMDTALLKDSQGRVAGAYVMFKDVSNLRSLEQQVQRSDRLAMIGQIAAGTAHEIRNPLTSIKGFLQVLKKTLREHDMDKEYGYTELMLNEINRINELVSEFLLLSKPRHTTLVQVDISAVIREILPIINNEAILHGVAVEYRSELDPPPITADREMLKQVFINLCKNGIEAMASEGGTLTITEKKDPKERRLHVYVQDTGPGIPAFLIDKIFDPFFTTKEEGTGLGLSVCQRIIHDIGGTLRVSSKGFGTMFVVSIPYSTA